jgi:uncharacterized protein (TIGR01244 family)
MNPIKNSRLFLLSVLAGVGIVLLLAVYSHLNSPPPLLINSLTRDISVSEQLKPESMNQLKESGFASVIDLRPDGEAKDQPSSEAMSLAAKQNKLVFFYIPVPHGDIPEQSVNQLAEALRSAPKPVLMYCRSGRRAARTWSLVEASRHDGMDAESILAAVTGVGQSAEDLSQNISLRISQRADKDHE